MDTVPSIQVSNSEDTGQTSGVSINMDPEQSVQVSNNMDTVLVSEVSSNMDTVIVSGSTDTKLVSEVPSNTNTVIVSEVSNGTNIVPLSEVPNDTNIVLVSEVPNGILPMSEVPINTEIVPVSDISDGTGTMQVSEGPDSTGTMQISEGPNIMDSVTPVQEHYIEETIQSEELLPVSETETEDLELPNNINTMKSLELPGNMHTVLTFEVPTITRTINVPKKAAKVQIMEESEVSKKTDKLEVLEKSDVSKKASKVRFLEESNMSMETDKLQIMEESDLSKENDKVQVLEESDVSKKTSKVHFLEEENMSKETDKVQIIEESDLSTKISNMQFLLESDYPDKSQPLYEKKNTENMLGIPAHNTERRPSFSLEEVKLMNRKQSLGEIFGIDEDEKWLRWIQKKFEEIAGEDGQIDLQEFKGALKVKKSFFAERFFALFDKDQSGTIELNELMEGLHMLTKGSPKEKLKFLFDVYDVDGSGSIEPDELKIVLKSCMDESSLSLTEEALDELTMTLFESADADDSGAISYEELVAELERHPGVIENLTISAANWIRPPEKRDKKLKPRYFSLNYIVNNVRKVVFLAIYLLITVALFTVSAVRYRSNNWCVIIARGCGMALNFNCAFVLVLMLRNSLTWLRSTKLGNYLPLDQSILFHKIVGYVITILSAGHTVAHLGNLAYVQVDNQGKNSTHESLRVEYWEYLFTMKGGIGWIGGGFAFISGDILIVILIIMVLCSLPCVRRSGHFQVFYWSHMLYVLFWIMLILHGPIFWYFFIIPGTIFVIEKIMNSKLVKHARYGKVYIKEVNLLPSKVTHLVIARPHNFHYKAGDYIFINIPDIAHYEWHPFTISSAPEVPGEVWLHVRSVGNWTNRLYEYFDKYRSLDTDVVTVDMENGVVGSEVTFQGKNNNRSKSEVSVSSLKFSSIKSAGSRAHSVRKNKKQMSKTVKVRVYIDGPYGTATREIFDTEHAVLVGSGIGVTPFASILQSIMSRYNMAKTTCPKCDHIWVGHIPESLMKMKKLDFIWINRDQKSFEWFVSLLARLEIEQAHGENDSSAFDNFLDMQMYMTSALSMSDMKGMALQMAMEMMHKKGGKDLVTGLKTRTQPGRPNWSKIFDKIAAENKGKVKVFFCGSPLVAKTLKEQCQKRGMEFAKENF